MPKTYTPLQDPIPEEDPRLDLSSDDESNFRLHRIDRSTSRSQSPRNNDAEPSILAPLVRKSTDLEAYLDTLTEDEQQLLSASKDHDIDDLDLYGSGKAAVRRKLAEAKRKKLQAKQGGWRAVYYSKTWWRTLVVVIIALGLLVWGFLKYTKARSDGWEEYDMPGPDSYFPTPRGGTLEHWADSYEKASKLVEQMTLIEKVNITTGTGWQMGPCVGNTGPAELVGFPSLCLQDGPLGIRFADHISAFPAGITTGATWNRDLMRRRGEALGLEARLKGVNVILGPSMGPLGMMPAGGRNWEGFGSDPVLQAVAAAETIRGIQSKGVMATAKHYIMNEQEHFRQPHEWGIDYALSSNIDDRALHEVFLWPFAESVRADVASVMCAYNQVNNSYSCENSKLLNGILKDELGFQGFVQSDWLAQRSGVNSAVSGLDMSMPGDGLHWADGRSLWGPELTRSALNASVPMERLNDMVTRIVAAWYQLGQDAWERPPPEGDGGPTFSSWTNDEYYWRYPGSPGDDSVARVNRFVDAQGTGEEAHSIIARKVAAEGIVLAKNADGVLPLSRTPKPNADRPYRVGVYGDDGGPAAGPNVCPNRGCNSGTLAMGWGSGAVEFPYLVSPIDALQGAWQSDVQMTPYLRNAVMPADTSDKDLCLVFVSADSGEGFISAGGIHGDRNNLFLQKGGDTLIQTVATNCGGPTVVVVHAVGPVVVDPWIDLPGVQAVLFAHLPGQESGNALIDVLFGEVDASGRLPYTVGKSLEDYGPGAQVLYEANAPVPQVDFSDALYIDHRYFDRYNISPRYEFGFGLSYTSWELSDMKISSLHKGKPSRLPAARPPDAVNPPSYDTIPPQANASVLFPEGFRVLSKYVYPYLPTLDATTPPPPPEHSDSDENEDKANDPPHRTKPSDAGGGAGGNPSLYEKLAQVDLNIQNTGQRAGQQVVQLYVSFPDNVLDPPASSGSRRSNQAEKIEFPDRVLRNFTKVSLEPGEKTSVSMTLTRKDLSYWSVREQNWVMPQDEFYIWVGYSSKNLPLSKPFEA
ncbi:glycosyl hydrolase family 3 N terminal domain-containing protein [Aspergillus egyptiacus]|nr:glycosyl hydrolase family 3 N terminal domain-containing protein [Aspergillus egyptiacus]